MKVKLIYKTTNNEFFGTSKTITIKRAKELVKDLLIKNTDIIEIYIKRYDGWRYIVYKTLYKK
jgi:hypothetical protein